MTTVEIDLEERWVWFLRGEPLPNDSPQLSAKVELPDAFVAEYNKVSERFFEMQRHLEHCYRHELRLSPLPGSPFSKKDA